MLLIIIDHLLSERLARFVLFRDAFKGESSNIGRPVGLLGGVVQRLHRQDRVIELLLILTRSVHKHALFIRQGCSDCGVGAVLVLVGIVGLVPHLRAGGADLHLLSRAVLFQSS